MNTNELTGAALDWAAATCNGDAPYLYRINTYEPPIYVIKCKNNILTPAYHYDWSQGGPIIEREGITLRCGLHGWDAELPEFDVLMNGASALEAAMRCFVASKLGDTVDIPKELQ